MWMLGVPVWTVLGFGRFVGLMGLAVGEGGNGVLDGGMDGGMDGWMNRKELGISRRKGRERWQGRLGGLFTCKVIHVQSP